MPKKNTYLKTCRELGTHVEAIDDAMVILHKKRFILMNMIVLMNDHPEWEAVVIDADGEQIYWGTKSGYLEEANALLNNILTYYDPKKPIHPRLINRVNQIMNYLEIIPPNSTIKSVILDNDDIDTINQCSS